MGIEKIYESDREQAYAQSNGQVVSRSLFGVIERGDTPLDGGFGEAVIIEVEPPAVHQSGEEARPLRVRVDTVPQDTVAPSPDDAAAAAAAMQSLGPNGGDQLNYRAQYLAD